MVDHPKQAIAHNREEVDNEIERVDVVAADECVICDFFAFFISISSEKHQQNINQEQDVRH